MKKLKGPELKMPELKVPPVVADLYYDLRDRRLLPLIALVVVAIVAVPILMGADAETAPPPSAADLEALEANPPAQSSALAVVEATPGLRDYRKRLRGRSASDPFKQQYTGLPGSAQAEATTSSSVTGSSESSGGSGAAGMGGTATSPQSTAPEGSGEGGGGGAGTGGNAGDGDSDQRFFAYRPDVRFGPAGSEELHLYEDLPLGRLLPQEKPVLVFIGSSEDGKRVAFNLTREVTLVRGPGRCIGGKENCSLLILRAGQAVDLLTTTPGRVFRLHVMQIDFVEVERPKPAGSSSAAADDRLSGFQNFSK